MLSFNFKSILRPLQQPPPSEFFLIPSRAFSKPNIYDHNLQLKSLVRDGKIESARKLFDQMPERDVVSWNTMVAAYWRQNDVEESTRLFRLMPTRSVVSWNCMVSGFIDNGELEVAFKYFNDMPVRNIASWNAIISGLVKNDRVDEAERLFDEMQERNVISYTAMVDGFVQKGEIKKARQLFDRMPSRNSVSWTVMINGYAENGMFGEARLLFEQMPEKTVVACTAMVTAFCKEGDIESARILFDNIESRDLVSWNAMIAGYAHNGQSEAALKLHRKMMMIGVRPDHSTLVVTLMACSILASLQIGKQNHAIALKTRLDLNTSVCNALMTMYSKCGNMGEVDLIFQNVSSRDLVSWNTVIAAYAQHGHFEIAITMVRDLLKDGRMPDGITFLSVLSACSHAGMVEDSLAWFNLMVQVYEVSPGSEHFSCLVDIFCRAGMLEKAYEIIMNMPFEADAAVWGALLAASRVHLNVELGELAASKLVKLDPHNSGAYVMLSNIYAAAGMWTDVTKVRLLMKEQGIHKQRGHSWMEIEHQLHLFMGGDMSHRDIGRIIYVLRRLRLHMQPRNDEADPSLFLGKKIVSCFDIHHTWQVSLWD